MYIRTTPLKKPSDYTVATQTLIFTKCLFQVLVEKKRVSSLRVNRT